MSNTPIEMGAYSILGIVTVLWTIFVVFGVNPWDSIPGENTAVMLATLLGGLGVFDLAETFGFVEYP